MQELLEPQVLFEDNSFIVIIKPSGMTVNKADTTRYEKTVQEWLEVNFTVYHANFQDDLSDFYKRAGIVHRLDKETSGILLVAKTENAFYNLQRQFKERDVNKKYLALVHGILDPKIGEIDVPVGRLPWNRMRFGVVAGGRDSLTKYRVKDIYSLGVKQEMLSLVEAFPKTGRTHQLRVHFKYLNHQIFSDPLYSGRKTAINDRKMLPRLFLHAAEISFFHPESSQIMKFTSELPNDLSTFLTTHTIKQ